MRWSKFLKNSGAAYEEKDVFQNNGNSIRDNFVLPILSYYDDNEKAARQKIIDKETNLKRSTSSNE